MGMSQKQAAQALGLKRRMIQYYEKGERDGDKVEVPKAVRLACYALTVGISDYLGPDEADGPKKKGMSRASRTDPQTAA
jgi:transcriptional regulator with XRE-family HTH domain